MKRFLIAIRHNEGGEEVSHAEREVSSSTERGVVAGVN